MNSPLTAGWWNNGGGGPALSYATNNMVFNGPPANQSSVTLAVPAPGYTQTQAVADWAAQSVMTFAKIRDGTSNTIFFAERYTVCNTPSNPNLYVVHAWNIYDDAQTPTTLNPWGGAANWATAYDNPANGWDAASGFTGVVPQWAPNDAQCVGYYLQSFSPAVLLVGMGDGSVRGVGPNITLNTWRFANHPADGGTLGADW
jgi:hypothetical protein